MASYTNKRTRQQDEHEDHFTPLHQHSHKRVKTGPSTAITPAQRDIPQPGWFRRIFAGVVQPTRKTTSVQKPAASNLHSSKPSAPAPNFKHGFYAAAQAVNSGNRFESRLRPHTSGALSQKPPFTFVSSATYPRSPMTPPTKSSDLLRKFKTPSPSTSASQEARAQALRTWKMDCAIAKSEGKEPPPRPPSATRVSVASALKGQYRRSRPPMGMEKHKLDMQKRRQEQTQQLVAQQQQCRTPESNETYLSREAYMSQVARVTEALDPSPSIDLTLNSRSNLRRNNAASQAGQPRRSFASGAFIPQARKVTDLEEALRIAKRTRDAPGPQHPTTFNFDKLKAELLAKDREAEDLLEGKAQRKRVFPKRLDAKRQQAVDKVFSNVGFSSAITAASVQHKDITRLKGQTWLNDEIVTFYSQLLNLRAAEAEKARQEGGNDVMSLDEAKQYKTIHAFNSFFWKNVSEKGHASVKRWTRKIDLFAKDIVIIPINQDNIHWVCSAINIKEKRFEYYNSLGKPLNFVYQTLRKYLSAEYTAKNPGKTLDLSDWENYWDEDVPQQANASDCGVFTCQFMECLSRHVEGFDFDQRQMPYFRAKMVLELSEGRLISEETGST